MRLGRALAFSLVIGAAAPSALARGTCTLETKKLPPLAVEVAAKDATPFKLRVGGVPGSVEPGGTETPALVRVKGPLAFEAHMPNEAIPARTRRGVDDLSGMVHLAPATEKLTLHANVRAKLVDATVKLPGVELRGLTLPCDAITLDDVPEPKLSISGDDGVQHYVAKGTTLHFKSGPGKGATVEVAVDDPSALELKSIEEQGGWMRVTTRWADGTTLHGWVKRDELTEEGTRHERIGDAPLPDTAPACEPPHLLPDERMATATVATGTQVYAARYLGPWAKVVDGGKLQVRFLPKDDWVAIVSAPGITCPLSDAWIPRSAAKLPADTATAEKPPQK